MKVSIPDLTTEYEFVEWKANGDLVFKAVDGRSLTFTNAKLISHIFDSGDQSCVVAEMKFVGIPCEDDPNSNNS